MTNLTRRRTLQLAGAGAGQPVKLCISHGLCAICQRDSFVGGIDGGETVVQLIGHYLAIAPRAGQWAIFCG